MNREKTMTTALLRIASVISFLFAAGHTLGGRKDWSPMGETEVLQAMRSQRYEAFGVSRTYLDFFLGFGYSLSVTLLLQAVVLWQLARIARTDPGLVRPIAASFAIASLATAAVAWRFIFPIPAVFAAVLAVLLGVAAVLR
jgi:hypothetical protein